VKITFNFSFNFLNLAKFIYSFDFYLLRLKVFACLVSLLFKISSYYLELVDLVFNCQIEILLIAVAVISTIFFKELLKLESELLMVAFQF
jgi:hypothetical protein